jgi:hypothetical protein
MWPPMARPDSTAVGLLADSGGFKMPLPASDQYYCHSQVATFNLCKTTVQACNTTVTRQTTVTRLQPNNGAIPSRAGLVASACYNPNRLWRNGLHCNVKQSKRRVCPGLDCPRCPPIPYLPCVPCMGRGKCIVLSSLPSPRCRGSTKCRARGRPGQACRRVEEVVVCRRGGCAVQDEPGSRRSYCHAEATIQCKQL